MNTQSENRYPLIMGILNVTPDSFSDGGRYINTDSAIRRAAKMAEEGADIVDVGGESTRPGSDGISIDEELERVIPVIEGIVQHVDIAISIDTIKPQVAKAAVNAGATMINDVSTLRYGDELAQIAKDTDSSLVIMHSRKQPKNMQDDITYTNVVEDVAAELRQAANRALTVGVPKERIWLDPGIGFAKTPIQNMTLMGNLKKLVSLGYPVLVGPSRKSFIGAFTGAPVTERLGGTTAAVTACVMNGAAGIRIHDVGFMKQAAIIASIITEQSKVGETDA